MPHRERRRRESVSVALTWAEVPWGLCWAHRLSKGVQSHRVPRLGSQRDDEMEGRK